MVAVRECSWNELVTYGVSVPTTPEEKLSVNSMIQMLSSVVSRSCWHSDTVNLQCECNDQILPCPDLGHGLSHLNTMLEIRVDLVEVLFGT